MTTMGLAGLALVLAFSATPSSRTTLPAAAPPREPAPEALPATAAVATAAGTRFKCRDGRDLTALFAGQGEALVAIVDGGDGPHALPLLPWTDGPVKLTWSDGIRTLTWSPGVEIMWMDGSAHRMCGRGGHEH